MARVVGIAGERPESPALEVEPHTEPMPVLEILLHQVGHRAGFPHGCSSGQGNATAARAGKSTLV